MISPFQRKNFWLRILAYWRSFKKKASLVFHRIQDDIYEIDKAAHPYLQFFTLLLSIMVVVSILLPISFNLTPELLELERTIEKWVLLGFVLNFFAHLILTSNRLSYLRKRWFEALLCLVTVFILIDLYFSAFGFLEVLFFVSDDPHELFLKILKGYLLLFVAIKAVQYLPVLIESQKNAARFLVYSFLLLIGTGTVMLMLPGATIDGKGLEFIDALFTSTSAVCVTGLIVVDTATHFTLFGELIIMVLIQLGGIGIITFATFLFMYMSGGLGVTHINAIKDIVAEENTSVLSTTLKRVIIFTFLVEGIAAFAYYLSWGIDFTGSGQRLLFSIFHAISAFCNAGFSLFTNSLADPENVTNPYINIITMISIVIGGLGFTVVWEIIKRSREKVKWRKRLSIHSRTVLITTALLITAGTVLILMLEWNNTLANYTVSEKFMVSLFQSITTRTAGFNTVDIGAIGVPATLFMMMLMFIGGSPASTAGGIKTTTFAIVMKSITTTIRGYSRMELFKRTVSNSIIFRAMTVILLAVSCIIISTILLTITEDLPFLDLFYEEISALATVGLSRGITGDLSSWGKLIIIISMFWGRVGILTFMVAFATKADNRKYKYPEETIMVS